MLGTGLQFGRGEDRFYIPVKARKSQKQKQKQEEQQQRGNNKSDEKGNSKNKDGVFGGHKISKVSSGLPNHAVSAALPSSTPFRSNLQRFLDSTTPSVPAQYFSKTTMRGWRTCDVEFQPYYTLGDLWDSFKEWSAYGAGVPLVLDGSDSVVQYYVPYLSGIQLYGQSTTSSSPKSRQAIEDSDGDYYRDSSSDGSSDNEFEKGMKFSRELDGHHRFTKEIPFRIHNLSISDDHTTIQEGFSSDEGETGKSRGCLLFEFLEQDTPYSREPLTDKILVLARQYPGLITLRSCDLLPVSWISVAWYPIYRIPTGSTLKDLDACFLTYHSLSTLMEGSGSTQAPIVVYPNEFDGVPKISFPVFGMASYKFKGSMWRQNGVRELQMVNSLTQATDDRLRLLQVNHPDFQFFASHGMYPR